ncbi:MAG: SMI1/KNR4 family protein [Bacteroidota bacterium]
MRQQSAEAHYTADVIASLIRFWEEQGISSNPNTEEEIREIEHAKGFNLPDDFKSLYSRTNCMERYYPNDMDDEGFLFYPLEYLITEEEELAGEPLSAVTVTSETVILFAEYMHKSWLYGFKYNADTGRYVIGIMSRSTLYRRLFSTSKESLERVINNISIISGRNFQFQHAPLAPLFLTIIDNNKIDLRDYKSSVSPLDFVNLWLVR